MTWKRTGLCALLRLYLRIVREHTGAATSGKDAKKKCVQKGSGTPSKSEDLRHDNDEDMSDAEQLALETYRMASCHKRCTLKRLRSTLLYVR